MEHPKPAARKLSQLSEDTEITEHISPEGKEERFEQALAPKPQSSSKLLSLPPELREKIWKSLLTFTPLCQPLESKIFFLFDDTLYQFYPFKEGDDLPERYNSYLYDLQVKLFWEVQNISMVSRQCYIDVIEGAILYKSNKFSTWGLLDGPVVNGSPIKALKPSIIANISSFQQYLRLNKDSYSLEDPMLLAFAKVTQESPIATKRLSLDLSFMVGRNVCRSCFETIEDVLPAMKSFLALHNIQRLKSLDLKLYVWRKVELEDGQVKTETVEGPETEYEVDDDDSIPHTFDAWLELEEGLVGQILQGERIVNRDLARGLKSDKVFRRWLLELREMLTQRRIPPEIESIVHGGSGMRRPNS